MTLTTPANYRRHSCTRKHRTYTAMAKCVFRRAAWILGEGPYASVAYCLVTTIMLWPDIDAGHIKIPSH